MADYKLFSADSHVSEPPDLWINRIEGKFRDRAPHVEMREYEGFPAEFFIIEGQRPSRVAIGLASAAQTGDRKDFIKKQGSYKNARPGGWDPAERLKDQDLDGVDGEILHTTLGFRLFWMQDPDFQRACFRVYNDWLAEFCSYSPRRLVGLALISLHDIDLAVQELRRAANIGLKGAMIWCSPPEDRPFDSQDYDPFWAEAQDLGMPLTLHSATGSQESRTPLTWPLHNVVMHHEVERSLATLILAGVLARFPSLKFISSENSAGWVPFLLQRLDAVARRGRFPLPPGFTLKPSEYFHRQILVSYIYDPVAVYNRHLIGVDNLMWSSDYPHEKSTWPRSRDLVDRDFNRANPVERRKIVRDNIIKAYGLDGVAKTPSLNDREESIGPSLHQPPANLPIADESVTS